MKLLIKQRVLSWTDSYDVYDEEGNAKYFVKDKLVSLGHNLQVFDTNQTMIGSVKQKLVAIMPSFEIEIGGKSQGKVQKQFTLLKPKFKVDYNGWRMEGDYLGWNYDVMSGNDVIMHISKEVLNIGDTYVIDIKDPENEVLGLMFVIAIDAANSIQNK